MLRTFVEQHALLNKKAMKTVETARRGTSDIRYTMPYRVVFSAVYQYSALEIFCYYLSLLLLLSSLLNFYNNPYNTCIFLFCQIVFVNCKFEQIITLATTCLKIWTRLGVHDIKIWYMNCIHFLCARTCGIW